MQPRSSRPRRYVLVFSPTFTLTGVRGDTQTAPRHAKLLRIASRLALYTQKTDDLIPIRSAKIWLVAFCALLNEPAAKTVISDRAAME
jgi:hypothetical protein